MDNQSGQASEEGSSSPDYDLKFQEDLERAQALSLESLALEKFRLQKLEQLHAKESQSSFAEDSNDKKEAGPSKGVKVKIKPRPRPEPFNTSSNPLKIIAPPPSNHRKSSTTQSTSSQVEGKDKNEDLISFGSPSPPHHSSNVLDEFSGALSIKDDILFPNSERKSIHDSVLTIGEQSKTLEEENFLRFQPPNQHIPRIYPRLSLSSFNLSPHFSSLNAPLYPPVLRRSQAIAYPRPLGVTSESDINLDVRKYMGKKDDNNLIDLVPMRVDPRGAHVEPKSNCEASIRESVLEAFDPLLFQSLKEKVEQKVDFEEPKCSEVVEKMDPNGGGIEKESPVKENVVTTPGRPPRVPLEDDGKSEGSSIYDVHDPFDFMNALPSQCSSEPVYATVNKDSPRKSLNDSTESVAFCPPPPPLPPRSITREPEAKRQPVIKRRQKSKSRLYENIQVMKRKSAYHDSDLKAFHSMVKKLRGEFLYSDSCTNPGLVISPILESCYSEGTSIKIIVRTQASSEIIAFTCDVTSSVEHVILHVVYEIEERSGSSPNHSTASAEDFVLKVSGLSEYLSLHSSLADYEYVHQCIKLEKDVELTLLPLQQLRRPLARTAQDDKRDSLLTLDDLLPNEPVHPISHDTLIILLETLENEMEKFMHAAAQLCCGSPGSSKASLQCKSVVQAVKAVTALLGSVETLEITYTINALREACHQFSVAQGVTSVYSDTSWPEIMMEDGDYSFVTLRRGDLNSSQTAVEEGFSETIAVRLEQIREAVNALIETYCHAFRVDFQLKPRSDLPTMTRLVADVMDPLLLHVEALHRPMQSWKFDDYYIICQVYHGTRPVQSCMPSSPVRPTHSFYDRIAFDCWLEIEDLALCLLPRESRLVLSLYGRTLVPPEEGDGEASSRSFKTTELGWVALQLFNYDGVLAQGSFLLSLWPVEADKILGPAPATGTHPLGDFYPVLGVELPDYGGRVLFPPEINCTPPVVNEFTYLDHDTQVKLLQIIEQDTIIRCSKLDMGDKADTDRCGSVSRLLLWEYRHYLHSKPEALPKILLLAPSWDWSCIPHLHSLLHVWKPMDPLSAFQLLLPCFSDTEVRRMAIQWIRAIASDELVDYLPQLVQALKHEAWEASPLAHFLLERALSSPRIAHHLYWLLTQTLPGQSPQLLEVCGCIAAMYLDTFSSVSPYLEYAVSIWDPADETYTRKLEQVQCKNNLESPLMDDRTIGETRYHRRLQLMLRALLAISGEAMAKRFCSQQLLVKKLYEVAENVKAKKDSFRLETLYLGLEAIHHDLQESATCLPLSPSLEVVGIKVRSCSYFPSFTLPLKLNFISSEVDGDSSLVPAIFKVGDDLQQDMVTLQIICIMDKLWLKKGLDLKMVTFSCVPTGNKRGMIEMITNAETLRKIQIEFGLTGSFKDRPIAEWLAKHNPSTLEYERAVENFTASCAGYSVATYILGICDRHNDNIMLKTSGHLFHIDFGKFLGDAQMFGNIKRDRTPFVLTSDMAYVINGGDKPSAKFHHFVDMCCQAFNIIRNNGNLLLNLFALMASSGIPGMRNAVSYVQRSLLPGLSEDEAAAEFSRMIQSSLGSRFTQINFFFHNLAQLRFSGDNSGGELLSFIPKTYTMQSEGRIRSVKVHGYQKRYDPEKYYIYILKVEREAQPDPVYLFRSFKEFCELDQKLCARFPLVKCYRLSSYHVGRSNIKQVAEKRRADIERFLKSLLSLADEISHSDLVYTFFHPLLRDQQEADIHVKKFKGSVKESNISSPNMSNGGRLRGQLKLSISYARGALSIMVHHARSLPLVGGNQEPSSYVKIYLLPDPTKATKRKTKIVRRSSHPTFMEMMEYFFPLEAIMLRTLQATVWNYDPLQENEFLGGISLPLNSLGLPNNTTTEWYPLVNVIL